VNRYPTVTKNGTPKDAVCKVLLFNRLQVRRVGIEPTTYRFTQRHRYGPFPVFPLGRLRILGRNLLKSAIGRLSDRNQSVIWFCRFQLSRWLIEGEPGLWA